MTPSRHKQILDLFEASIDLQPAERDAYLAERCANDPDLRREVDSLLVHHDPQTILEPPPSNRDIQRVSLRHLTPAIRRGGEYGLKVDRSRLMLAATILTVTILLVVLAVWQYLGIRRTIHQALASQLKATLASNVAAVEYWFQLRKKESEEWAAHPQVISFYENATRETQKPRETDGVPNLVDATNVLQELLAAEVGRDDVLEIVGLNSKGGLLFSTDGGLADDQSQLTPEGIRLFGGMLLGDGSTVATHPVLVGPLATGESLTSPEMPSILIGAPVTDGSGELLGALVFRLESGQQFTNLLDLACEGEETDVFAFDATGRLLSASRYDSVLRELGLIPDRPGATSVFTVVLRNPGVDLTKGLKSVGPRKRLPLTRMAAAAVTGTDGIDFNGYLDVRGVRVVGAWDWLDAYRFGVAIEVEYERAYAPLSYVRWSAIAMLSALTCLAAGTALSSISWLKVKSQFEETRQLGQYVMDGVIGRGGMGTVYRAFHALLRRPTAIKIIDPQQIRPETIARFEREVRLASMLSHPNTIEIYDFGQSSEKTLYCAMELIDGFTLADIVRIEGPIPIGRVIHILQGVCGSLAEAHSLGMIHRDIKPANIMICHRGGVPDVVKVLDFGMAKLFQDDQNTDVTQAGFLGGTPGYIAPEQLRSTEDIGPKTDIYALGAVAFFLLTGREVFAGRTPIEVLEKVALDDPPRLADVVQTPVPEPLDTMVTSCLAKNSTDRPAAITDVQVVLDSLASAVPWDHHAAQEWWRKHDRPHTDEPETDQESL